MHMNTLNESLGLIGRIVTVIGLGAALAACGGDGTTASTASTAGSSSTGSSTVSGSTTPPTGTSGTSSSTPSGTTSPTSGSTPASTPAAHADSITLSWAAPTENTDGSALTNLSGFNIYYGNSATAMTQKVSINTVGLLTYVVGNLAAGTWYFEVVAVNSSGVQSGPSSTVSATI
jgi:hypothetical protein